MGMVPGAEPGGTSGRSVGGGSGQRLGWRWWWGRRGAVQERSGGDWGGDLPGWWSGRCGALGSSRRLLQAEGSPAPSQAQRARPRRPLTAGPSVGARRAGWERPHTQLIRPVASWGDVFCVEKSWETSLCGAERTRRRMHARTRPGPPSAGSSRLPGPWRPGWPTAGAGSGRRSGRLVRRGLGGRALAGSLPWAGEGVPVGVAPFSTLGRAPGQFGEAPALLAGRGLWSPGYHLWCLRGLRCPKL